MISTNKVADLYQGGMSCVKIAKYLGCTLPNILYHINKSGVTKRDIKSTKKLPDDEILKTQFLSGDGITSLSKRYGCCRKTVARRLGKLGLRDPTRGFKKKLPEDTVLIDLYRSGLGFHRIGKMYNCHPIAVRNKILKLGVFESGRQHKFSTTKRNSHRVGKEFLVPTKRKRFIEENGICQICKKLISEKDPTNHYLATYHHILPIKKGGGPEPENCMVLHRECHENNFYELHGVALSTLKRSYEASNQKRRDSFPIVP